MSDMDEISFWIYTKRAPCLFNFDSLTSSSKPESIHSVPDNVPIKKKKRKLSILDDESVLSEKQQHLYFEVSQIKNQPVNGCESSTAGSDIDFNIKKSSIQDKRKRLKLQRSSRTTLHKKNKLVTSTPKPQVLRRSLRKAQSSLNNNSQLNTSFEVFNSTVHYNNESLVEKKSEVLGKVMEKQAGGDQTVPSKPSMEIITQPIAANDKYEDLSDVSGFTANYIRSTKIHSKTPRKMKSKQSLMKESHQSIPKEETRMVVCVNKSMNTGMPHALNCSTDSSQNVINLVTIKSNNKTEKADKSTSLLRFVNNTTNEDVQGALDSDLQNKNCSKDTNNLDSSFSRRTSRYPKRNKNTPKMVAIIEKPIDKRKKMSNGHSEFNSKENPNDNLSRTRSGRSIALKLRQTDNSVLVVSNTAEQLSSTASMNVASPPLIPPSDDKRKKRTSRQVRNTDNCRLRRDSLRDKSGFAQCFSDSDDNEPQKQRKFFC